MASKYLLYSQHQALGNLKKQILQAKKDKVLELDIGGGEPTMYPRLKEVLGFAYQKGLRCAICTNGFKFSNAQYVKKFSQYRPIGIKISFHSHREKVFDFITRVKGSYRAILEAIDNIIKELNVYPASRDSYLLANIVIHKYNFRELIDIVNFLHAKGVYVVKLSQLVLSGSVYSHPDLLVSPGVLQPYLSKAVDYLKEKKMVYYIDKFPICMLENERKNFVPLNDTATHIKLKPCLECQYNRKCCGISKLSLIAKYGRGLIKYKELFPRGFFESFFTAPDLNLMKKL